MLLKALTHVFLKYTSFTGILVGIAASIKMVTEDHMAIEKTFMGVCITLALVLLNLNVSKESEKIATELKELIEKEKNDLKESEKNTAELKELIEKKKNDL